MFRQIGEPRWFSFPDVLKNAESVIERQVASRTATMLVTVLMYILARQALLMSTVLMWWGQVA